MGTDSSSNRKFFILTHGKGLFSRLIRFGQRLRFGGGDQKYTWWNHAAIIVSKDGELIEALSDGVRLTHLSNYTPTEYHLVHLEPSLADQRDRAQMVEFAYACSRLQFEYDWLTIVSIAASLLTGCTVMFEFDGKMICSELVARALERTSVIFDHSPSYLMPADLAKHFQVEPPKPGTDKGRIPKAAASTPDRSNQEQKVWQRPVPAR